MRSLSVASPALSSGLRLAVVCALSASAMAQPGPPLVTDAVAREFTAYVGPLTQPFNTDTVAREFSAYVGPLTQPFNTDTVAREFSAYVGPLTQPFDSDAVAREFSLFVGIEQFFPVTDAVAREFSVHVPSPDLRVANIAAPLTATTDDPMTVTWTGRNVEAGTAQGMWVDRVFVSTDAVFDVADTQVAEVMINGPVPATTEYAGEATFAAPSLPGSYWIIVIVDANDQVAEDGTDAENNTFADDVSFLVQQAPRPNLQVSNLVTPASTTPGSVINLTWSISNVGTAPAVGPWTESVALSDDNVPGGDIAGPTFSFSNVLQPATSIDRAKPFTVPSVVPGIYWVVVCVDSTNVVLELDNADNCAVQTLCVDCQIPDLAVTAVVPETTVFAGQLLNVSWSVSNVGGDAALGSWTDRVFLSSDAVPGGDIAVGDFLQTGPLPVAGSYTATQAVMVPIELSGNFFIIVQTDVTDAVTEPVPGASNVLASDFSALVFVPDLPDLQVTSITGPMLGITGQTVTLAWEVTNTDALADATGSWTDRVYRSDDDVFDPAPGGSDQLVAGGAFSGTVIPLSFYLKTAQVTLPGVPGSVWFFVETDALGQLFEGANENNNTALHMLTVTQPAYTATVLADVVEAPADTLVTLSGQTVSTTDGSPVPGVPLTVRLRIKGTRRVFNATSDLTGNFSVAFAPLPGEAGLYNVFADHPGVQENAAVPQATFTLVNLTTRPPQVSQALEIGIPVANQTSLHNVGDVAVSGITHVVEGAPPNISVQVTTPTTLGPLATMPLSYTLTAASDSVPSGTVTVTIRAPVSGVETDLATFSVAFFVTPITAELVINPGSLSATMLRGVQTPVEFVVTNTGGGPATGVSVLVPCSPNPGCVPGPGCVISPDLCVDGLWLNLVTPIAVGDILPGASRTVRLSLLPSSTFPLSVVTGQIVVQANEANATAPFSFRAISNAMGSLSVIVEDEITFYGPGGDPLNGGGPLVQNASITVKDALDGTVVTTGNSGTTGTLVIAGLPEGTYTVDVTAPNHGAFSTTVAIHADEVTEIRPFLPERTVSYSWSVVPTTVEDVFTIVIDSVFETFVPVPVITMEPTAFELTLLPGETLILDVTITNHGLVAAQNMKLNIGSHPDFQITALITDIGVLAAQSSVVIPVTITRNSLVASSNIAGVTAQAASSDCRGIPCSCTWNLICRIPRTYGTGIFLDRPLDCPSSGPTPTVTVVTGSPDGAVSQPFVFVATPTISAPIVCEPPPNGPDEGPPCRGCGCAGNGPGGGGTGGGGPGGGGPGGGAGGSGGSDAGSDKTHPVLLYSGEEHMRIEDLRIRGREMDFIWGRTYRSKIGPNTAQGNGWDFWFNAFLEQSGTDLIVSDGHGRRDTNTPQVDGTWGRDEFFREISLNPDGTYTQLNDDRGKRIYHAFDGSPVAGKLLSMTDRNGNTIALSYDAAGRLVRITDTLDRDILVAYNTDGFIASITDFIGRQIKYTYYLNGDLGGSSGDLKSVTTQVVNGTPNGNDFPQGKTTVYTYTTGFVDDRLNHNLLTITDPKGQTFLQNEYYATQDPMDADFDRVKRQTWGDVGDIVDIVYVPLVPSVANRQAIMKTILNDRVGNVSEYDFDIKNRLVRQRDFTGRANPDLPTTLGSNRPTGKLRPTDPDFFEATVEWNNDSLPTRIIHPNGNVTETVYELAVDPGTQRRNRGNILSTTRSPGTHSPIGDQLQIDEAFIYDSNFSCGSCGFNFVTDHTDGRGNHTFNTYDPVTGNKTHTQHRIPSIVEDFEYNAFGQVTAHTLPDNGSGHRRRDEYTYYTAGPQRGYMKQKVVDAGFFNLTTTYEYDAVGNIIRVTDPRGHDTQYMVNQMDQVVREISREVTPGSGIRYEKDTFYDANDNAVRMDTQNKDETGTLQANTHFTDVYEYDILNYRTRECREMGTFTGPIPGTNQLPTCASLPDSEFLGTEYTYDANRNQTLVRYGEAVEGRQPANALTTLYDERDLAFRQIRAAGDPDQSTTQYDYDENRNVVARRVGIENVPRVHTSVYDSYDRLVTSIDPMGNTIGYNYDENNNQSGMRTDGELVDIEGGASNVRLTEMTYVYDAIDRRIRSETQFFDTESGVAIGDGLSVRQMFYSDNSQVIRTLNDNLHQSLTAYDTANRRSVMTDAKGNTSSYQYDADDNVTAIVEVEKSDLLRPDEVFATSYAYDGLDRQISMTDNVGNTGTYLFDSRNNRTKTVDALGNVVRSVFDGINRLTSTVREMRDTGDGTGVLVGTITTGQTWDDTSRLTGQTDDNGNTTTYVYDALNRKTGEVYADATVDTYLLDVHDNRVGTTDPNGSVTTCQFDLLNRQTRKDIVPGVGVSDDTTFEVYKYDGLSRLIHAEDDDSLVTRSYDSLSRVTRETLTIAKGAPDQTVGTTASVYDGVGNMTQCVYPGGRTINCTFDELERKKIISDAVTGLVANYDYVGPRRVERRDYGNGTRAEYSYDGITGVANPANDFAVRKIIRTRHTVIAAVCTTDADCPTGNTCETATGTCIIDDRTYTWDRLYNKTERKDVRPGGPQLTHDYSYDSIYRLIHTNVTDAASAVVRDTVYNLDGVGNRISVVGTPNPGSYTLDATVPEPADSQMNQYTITSFDARGFDANGNLVAIGVTQPPSRSIAFDYRNQMVRHADAGNATTATYQYDALHRRIERIVDGGSPVTTRYFYSDGWRACEEQDEVRATLATYVYGLYIDDVLNMRRTSSSFYYHRDDLYTVMSATDSNRANVERYEYGDYGDPSVFDGTGMLLAQSVIENPYRFTGRRFDTETHWHYYRTRYLDSMAGRFTTRDSIGVWGDGNNSN